MRDGDDDDDGTIDFVEWEKAMHNGPTVAAAVATVAAMPAVTIAATDDLGFDATDDPNNKQQMNENWEMSIGQQLLLQQQ